MGKPSAGNAFSLTLPYIPARWDCHSFHALSMARHVMNTLVLLTALTTVNGYWLMGIENFITTERIDPLVNPGKVSGHAHSVLGGSNFRMNTNTAQLRQSECTSVPIPQDKSNYWFPHLYFQWSNGNFSSLNGGAVIYYLFSDKAGTTTAFPDDFRMLSGDPTLRTYDPNSHAQQAITFLCLDFNGVTTRHNSLPAKVCPSGIRAQVNFPSCWDGKNVDSPDHKSHVAFLSGGPDSGSCSDPKYPFTLPRVFIEVYWSTGDFDRSQAMNPSQPFVYSYGDPTGYGYHADFLNGWDKGVLQRAVDECNCDQYGDPTCCVNKGIFSMNKGMQCRITKAIDEQTTGTLTKLPGNNPVQKEGVRATMFPDPNTPTLLAPIYAYTGNTPTVVGKPIPPASGGPASSVALPSSSYTSGASSASAFPSPSSVALPTPSGSAPPVFPSSVAVSPSSVIPPSPSGSPAPPAIPSSVAASPSFIVLPSASGGPAPPAYTSSAAALPSSISPSPSEPAPPASAKPTDGSSTPVPGPSSAVTDAPPTPTAPAPSVPTPSGDCEYGEEDDNDGDDASPAPSLPLNPPTKPNPSSPPKPAVLASVGPATTLVVGGGQGNGVPQSPAPTTVFPPPAANSAAMCQGGKYRHKRLRELKAQGLKRAVHHARSLHENSRRFMKPHVHARVF